MNKSTYSLAFLFLMLLAVVIAGCENGTIGKDIKPSISFGNGNETNQTCTDSDGGINIYVKGVCSENKNNFTTNYTDFCISSNRLNEYYCADLNNTGNVTCNIKYVLCPKDNPICKDGRCTNLTFINRTNYTINSSY